MLLHTCLALQMCKIRMRRIAARPLTRLARPPRAAMPGEAAPSQPPASPTFVSAADLRARLGDGGDGAKKTLVVDVRDDEERARAIAGALHVPAHKIRAKGEEADKALDAIVRCEEGTKKTEIFARPSHPHSPTPPSPLSLPSPAHANAPTHTPKKHIAPPTKPAPPRSSFTVPCPRFAARPAPGA